MSAAPAVSTPDFLASVGEDLVQAFSTRPDFGSVGIIFHFHEGAVVRVEVSRSVLKKRPENPRTGDQ
jgi:hypothetical protein